MGLHFKVRRRQTTRPPGTRCTRYTNYALQGLRCLPGSASPIGPLHTGDRRMIFLPEQFRCRTFHSRARQPGTARPVPPTDIWGSGIRECFLDLPALAPEDLRGNQTPGTAVGEAKTGSQGHFTSGQTANTWEYSASPASHLQLLQAPSRPDNTALPAGTGGCRRKHRTGRSPECPTSFCPDS